MLSLVVTFGVLSVQVKRVQNYVEALDVLKVKNSTTNGQQQKQSTSGQKLETIQEHSNGQKEEQKPIQSLMDMPIQYKPKKKQEIEEEEPGPFVLDSSTKWETFEHHPLTPLSSTTTANTHTIPPRFNWEFFD